MAARFLIIAACLQAALAQHGHGGLGLNYGNLGLLGGWNSGCGEIVAPPPCPGTIIIQVPPPPAPLIPAFPALGPSVANAGVPPCQGPIASASTIPTAAALPGVAGHGSGLYGLNNGLLGVNGLNGLNGGLLGVNGLNGLNGGLLGLNGGLLGLGNGCGNSGLGLGLGLSGASPISLNGEYLVNAIAPSPIALAAPQTLTLATPAPVALQTPINSCGGPALAGLISAPSAIAGPAYSPIAYGHGGHGHGHGGWGWA